MTQDKRQQAMQWWNSFTDLEEHRAVQKKYYPQRNYGSLYESEIQSIWEKEVPQSDNNTMEEVKQIKEIGEKELWFSISDKGVTLWEGPTNIPVGQLVSSNFGAGYAALIVESVNNYAQTKKWWKEAHELAAQYLKITNDQEKENTALKEENEKLKNAINEFTEQAAQLTANLIACGIMHPIT